MVPRAFPDSGLALVMKFPLANTPRKDLKIQKRA